MTNLMLTVLAAVPTWALTGLVLFATPSLDRNRWVGGALYAVFVEAGMMSFMASIALLTQP